MNRKQNDMPHGERFSVIYPYKAERDRDQVLNKKNSDIILVHISFETIMIFFSVCEFCSVVCKK